MNTNYEEVAARAERGELAPKPGTLRRGSNVTADAQRSLWGSDRGKQL